MAAKSDVGVLLPFARPLILCHDVKQDLLTNNVDLIGVFDSIRPRSRPPYPHRHKELCVYWQLTDFVGEVRSYVEIVEAASDELVFRSKKHVVRFPDRNKVVRTVFRIKGCPFDTPGLYLVQVYCQNQLVADHPLRLLS